MIDVAYQSYLSGRVTHRRSQEIVYRFPLVGSAAPGAAGLPFMMIRYCLFLAFFVLLVTHLRLYILRSHAHFVKPFGSEVHAVEPLQGPIGEGELHELVVVKQLLTELTNEKRLEIDDATIAVAELKFHSVVMQIVHIYHS